MSSTRKRPGYPVVVVMAGIALLFSQDLLIGKAYFENLPVASSSPVNNPQNRELENNLKALNSADSDERYRAVLALGKSGNPAAVEPLTKALRDQDSFVRSFAAVALGNLGDPRALDPLIKALGDSNQRVRRSAAEALGSLRNPGAVEALIKTLDNDNIFVRRSAEHALGDLGNPNAVDPLIKALGDEDDYIVTGASLALTQIGSAGIPQLVSALGDWTLGPRVAEILKSLGWQPSSDEEKIRFYAATRNSQALFQNWEVAQKVLLSDANTGNKRQAENAVKTLIGTGREEVLDKLALLLRARGNVETASMFLESGHKRLSELARNWAKENATEVQAGKDDSIVKWGSMKPQ